MAPAQHRAVGRGGGRGGGGSAGNETPGQLGTVGTAAFGIPLPALAPQRDGHGHHGHAAPTLGQPAGQEGEGDLPAGSGAEEMRVSHCRAVVIGGAGTDRACAAGSPPRRGPGAKGRAARPSQKETAPNKAPVRLEQLVPARQPPTGPGNTSRPRGRAPAPAPAPRGGPAPPRAAPPAPGPARSPRHRRGEFKPRGEPTGPSGAPAVSPGDPRDPVLAEVPAGGIPDAPARRGGGKCSAATAGSFPVSPAVSGRGRPRAGDTGAGRVSPVPGTAEPAVPGPRRARQRTGKVQREVPAGLGRGWKQPPAAEPATGRRAEPGAARGTGGAETRARSLPPGEPPAPLSPPAPQPSAQHPGRSGPLPAAGSGRLRRDSPHPAPAPPPPAFGFAPAPTWAPRAGARPGPGAAGV